MEKTGRNIMNSRYENYVGLATDFCVGFFISPLLYFLTSISVTLIENNSVITEGQVLLYIAILAGIILLLKREVLFELEVRVLNMLMMLVGFTTFWSVYLFDLC